MSIAALLTYFVFSQYACFVILYVLCYTFCPPSSRFVGTLYLMHRRRGSRGKDPEGRRTGAGAKYLFKKQYSTASIFQFSNTRSRRIVFF